MNMNQDNHSAQTAQIRPSKTLVSTVWLIPLIAAAVGGYLLVQNIRSQGPEITLLMDNADGISVNNTTIRVLNVEVGRISKIRLLPDKSGVELTAKINPDSADFMRKDTQFWIVKPRIDQNGVTGLNTLISGSYISFTPGNSPESARSFKVSDLPPITAIGQSGLRLHLTGKNNKMINVGSPILYENHIVGTVEKAKFNPADQTVQYSIFIQSPNENLVHAGSRFWLDSGIDIRLDGGGVHMDSAPLSTLLSGAISFDSPQSASQTQANNEQTFTIYNNRAEIENQPTERTLYYVTFFNGSVRGLDVGAPVEYKGIRIGSVADVPYFQNDDQQQLFKNGYIPVRIRIDPDRLDSGSHQKNREYWQDSIQTALNNGLTATLASNNLVLGSKLISLEDNASGSTVLKPHNEYGGNIVIATRAGGLDDLQAQVSKLLDKFNALPIDKTVSELNGSLKELQTTLKSAQKMLASANKLASQSSTQNLPAQLNQTLIQLRQTLQGVSPQSPMYQDVRDTLDSIDRTLKNAQPVINTLSEQPNALIFKRNTQDPVPQGK